MDEPNGLCEHASLMRTTCAVCARERITELEGLLDQYRVGDEEAFAEKDAEIERLRARYEERLEQWGEDTSRLRDEIERLRDQNNTWAARLLLQNESTRDARRVMRAAEDFPVWIGRGIIRVGVGPGHDMTLDEWERENGLPDIDAEPNTSTSGTKGDSHNE